jgi:hypothetical protein
LKSLHFYPSTSQTQPFSRNSRGRISKIPTEFLIQAASFLRCAKLAERTSDAGSRGA